MKAGQGVDPVEVLAEWRDLKSPRDRLRFAAHHGANAPGYSLDRIDADLDALATTAVSGGSVAGLRAALRDEPRLDGLFTDEARRWYSEGWNRLRRDIEEALAATPSAETDAQVAVLRKTLAAWEKYAKHVKGRAVHELIIDTGMVLHDTASTAKDYEAAVVAPWREAAHDALLPMPEGNDPDVFAEWNGVTERGYDRLRALLATTETTAQQEGAGE